MATRRSEAAALLKWTALAGKDIAFAIDTLGDGSRAISTMIFLAKRNYASDAFEILDPLYFRAQLAPDDGVQEWRAWVDRHEPAHIDLFDKYARLAASHMKIEEDWIEMEAEAPVEDMR